MGVFLDRRVSFYALGMALALAGGCGNSPGESCRKDSECGASLRCTFPKLDGAPAEKGICAPGLAEKGQFCTSNASCASGLFCSNDLPAAVSKPDGVCILPRVEGQGCFRDADCHAGLKCKKDPDGQMVCTGTAVLDAGGTESGGSHDMVPASIDAEQTELDSGTAID